MLVYSEEDAEQFGFIYHSVGYSSIRNRYIRPKGNYDVVFVGAEKGRINKIRQAYDIFSSAGLSCFFYVTMVKRESRRDDGIIYADKGLSFLDYLSYVMSAKCLFELVQEGSSGRTFRMMEAIMYNKMLVTNCAEILNTNYYKDGFVQLYTDVSEINPHFIVKNSSVIDYHYVNDFSPEKVLDFIASTW